jgi:hypothetical protein
MNTPRIKRLLFDAKILPSFNRFDMNDDSTSLIATREIVLCRYIGEGR